MIYRKEHEQGPNNLPDTWKENVAELLASIYKNELESQNKLFFLHGVSFDNELFIGVSLLDAHDETIIPTTYQISADLTDKTNSEKLLKTMVDSIGLFFDNYFATPDWHDYQSG